MGESILIEPQPKPSRFQFVPVPGEFTRGRWKCRDSVHLHAETLEFEKNGSKNKEEPNPNVITVSRKLNQPLVDKKTSDTIQVTSVEDNSLGFVDDSNSGETVVITRKNGMTILRKSSGISPPTAEVYDKIRELSIDDFESQHKKQSRVPPTPMNTPPASISEPSPAGDSLSVKMNRPKIFQVQAVKESEITPPVRKFSHENAALQHSANFKAVDLPECHSATVPANSIVNTSAQKPRVFQIQPVEEHDSIDGKDILEQPPTETRNQYEPTFQVIQTEDIKNISLDSVKNAIETPKAEEDSPGSSNVMITVSPTTERKEIPSLTDGTQEVASSAGSLEACGIPISNSLPNAPHSTPYGTPKDAQRSPTFPSGDDPTTLTTTASAPSFPSQAISNATDSSAHMMPIDNKIEQAMELVKTHLTYAVREEVDMLKNTIQDLEYKMREYQHECKFLRQHVSQDIIDQCGPYVRQQMQKYQAPTRRSISAVTGLPVDLSSSNLTNNNHSSPHMRNLQTQIQQIKQIPGILQARPPLES